MAKMIITVKNVLRRNLTDFLESNEPKWINLVREGNEKGVPVYVHRDLQNYVSSLGVDFIDPFERDRMDKDYIAIIPQGFSLDQVRLDYFELEKKKNKEKNLL